MIKELNLSVDYLKAVSGKFDVETIFYISLPEKSIKITYIIIIL